jgi:hypothetical protein
MFLAGDDQFGARRSDSRPREYDATDRLQRAASHPREGD